jgi:hypothetical protein
MEQVSSSKGPDQYLEPYPLCILLYVFISGPLEKALNVTIYTRIFLTNSFHSCFLSLFLSYQVPQFEMEWIPFAFVNVADIKYDNNTKALFITQEGSYWTIDCKNAINLIENTEDNVPFFIMYYIEKTEKFCLLKGIKVFTVFIEHEGVLHLRKYGNIIAKIRACYTKEPKFTKLMLLYDEFMDEQDEKQRTQAFAEVLKVAGIQSEITSNNGASMKLVNFPLEI